MAVIKYDVSDVETGGGGVEVPIGLHPGKIVGCTHRTAKSDGTTKISDLEVVVDFGEEYMRKWTYIKLPDDPSWDKDKHGWKLREYTDAIGLPPKGSIDPKKCLNLPVMVKIKQRRDDPDATEIKNLFKPGAESLSGADAAELADAASGAENDYSTWTKEDLTAEIEERGLEMPSGRISEAKLIDVLVEADAEADPNATEVEAEGDGELDETRAGYYGDWSDQDIKDELDAKEIKLAGRFSRNKGIEALVEAANEGNVVPDEGEPDAEPDEYDNFTDQELKDEIADRVKDGAEVSVVGRWTKDKAIAALREDDASAPF